MLLNNIINKGDPILCVDDNLSHYLEIEANITVGKIYECNYTFPTKEGTFVRFYDDNKQDRCILSIRFINCNDPSNKDYIKSIKLDLLKIKMRKLIKLNKVNHVKSLC